MASGHLLDLVPERRDEVQATVERHRGLSFAVFGSVARREDTDASDIDVLVRFAPGSSLFDLVHLSDGSNASLDAGSTSSPRAGSSRATSTSGPRQSGCEPF